MATTTVASNTPPLPALRGTNTVATDIHGIKDPVPIPTGWEWLWWVLTIAVIGAVVWFLWKWLQKKLTAPRPKIVVPPHRRAKDRLRGALGLISDPYAFCSLVSDVLREYLEERFAFHAPERTTEEFLNELWVSDRLEPEQKKSLEQFLTECDLVKFARHEPTEGTLRQLLETANKFVDETTHTSQELVPPVPADARGGSQ